MSGKQPNWALLALCATVGVLAFQWQALTISLNDLDLSVDINGMREGYEIARAQGTASWWFGSWINHATWNYFRPLISYAHYGQFWLLDHYGFQPLSWISMSLYAALCLAVGWLAFLMTGSRSFAFLTTLACTIFRADFDPAWLAYFPLVDNITAMLLQVLALGCFLIYLQRGNAGLVVVIWLLYVSSALCKEQGLTTPILALLLTLGLPRTRYFKPALAHVGMMTCAAVLIYKYAQSVAWGKGKIPFPIHNFYLDMARSGQWWLLGIFVVLAAAAYLAWRFRHALNTPARRGEFALGFALVLLLPLTLAPRGDLPFGVFPLVYLADNAARLTHDAAWGAVQIIEAGLLAYLFLNYRSLPLTITLCVAAAWLPTHIAGIQMFGGRVLFILPFLAMIVAHSVNSVCDVFAISRRAARFVPHWGAPAWGRGRHREFPRTGFGRDLPPPRW